MVKREEVFSDECTGSLVRDVVSMCVHDVNAARICMIALVPARSSSGVHMDFQSELISVVLQEAFTNGRTADIAKANDEDALHGRCAMRS